MRRAALEYTLPPERIAQAPAEPRDSARLLVLSRKTGAIRHAHVRDLPEYLSGGDCLVMNDTRVVPARFHARRASGGHVEGLFLRSEPAGWHVLLKPAGRLRAGERLMALGRGLQDPAGCDFVLVRREERGAWLVRPDPEVEPLKLLGEIGQTPLPPYIHRSSTADAERYQTVYARQPGAVAAPTAGLHFTVELLERLRARGVVITTVTLHVGLGTFQPLEVDDLSQHALHSEWYEFPAEAATAVNAARAAGRAVVAVGTTTARVLETRGQAADARGALTAGSGWTDLFIYPPYRWSVVDRLLTNFHLPGSTLLALVMALAGEEATRAAYAEAVSTGYRFFSYGDAMLII